jgi:hypothetical protein
MSTFVIWLTEDELYWWTYILSVMVDNWSFLSDKNMSCIDLVSLIKRWRKIKRAAVRQRRCLNYRWCYTITTYILNTTSSVKPKRNSIRSRSSSYINEEAPRKRTWVLCKSNREFKKNYCEESVYKKCLRDDSFIYEISLPFESTIFQFCDTFPQFSSSTQQINTFKRNIYITSFVRSHERFVTCKQRTFK